MKTKIFYNSIKDEFYPTSLYPHGGIPPFSVDVTDKYKEYRALELQGYTRTAGDDGLPVYTAPVNTTSAKAKAKTLLHATHHYELDSHDELFTEEQDAEFMAWRKQLVLVAHGKSEDLPETPEFMKVLLNG